VHYFRRLKGTVMPRTDYEDVESLLQPQARAALPLGVLLRMYLDPFMLFKNANRGTAFNRHCALAYNRGHRWMLVPYMRRWLCIASACLLALNPTAALASANPIFLVPTVGLGIVFTVGFVALVLTAVSYLGLGMTDAVN
jgi:hypothetical protein